METVRKLTKMETVKKQQQRNREVITKWKR